MGQLNLPDSAKIYIDTSMAIYTIEVHPDYWQLLQPLWQKFQAGQIELVTSELTLLESLVILFRQSNTIAVLNEIVNCLMRAGNRERLTLNRNCL